MIDYAEKRNFIRMPVSCPIELLPMDSAQESLEAELLDLSATGMRFVVQQPLATGDRLAVTVRPGNPITPPLEANVSVVRCTQFDRGFDVAASIDHVAPADYPDIA